MSVGAAYDAVASQYDAHYQGPNEEQENDVLTAMLERYIEPGDLVLDVGCGTGLLIDLLFLSPHEYVGIDVSEGMIREAERKWPYHEFRLRDMAHLSGQMTDNFDVCVSTFGALAYTPEALPSLLGMADALRPGGRLFLMTPSPSYNDAAYILNGSGPRLRLYSAAHLRALAVCAGFERVSIEGFRYGKRVSPWGIRHIFPSRASYLVLRAINRRGN